MAKPGVSISGMTSAAPLLPPGTFFVVGPTAVGKTEFALALAERWDAEIVSADAFQLYEGLDLLTAKPSPAELARVRHHLVGVIPPDFCMSAAEYAAAAVRACYEIAARGRRVIICGGSGLYVKALTHGFAPRPAGDPAVRAELERRPLVELVNELEARAPRVAAEIDRQNPRRVIRALELALAGVITPARDEAPWQVGASSSVRGVFLGRERAELQARIAARTAAMFAGGVLREVAEAAQRGLGAGAAQVIGWEDCLACLRGELRESAGRERITIATRQYVKRQLTWFKREAAFRPLDLSVTPLAAAVASCASG